jgi:putative flippase GtrA
MRGLILKTIDFFYPPFRLFMPQQTFRYAACGGFNTVLDILLFFISYNFIFDKQVVHFSVFALKPHIAAFLTAFSVTFPLGFYFSRYVVFTESNIRGRVQLFRYFLLVLICLCLNYFFLKLFVEHFNLYPTFAKVLTTGLVVTFSFLSQKHFTFRTVER